MIGVCSMARSRCCAKSLLASPYPLWTKRDAPYAPVRWMNQWDNLDGTIERGYGGRSIFWDGGHVREDLSRVSEYGRLLASLGINACAINNVNADPRILNAGLLSADRAHRRGVPALGRAGGDLGRLRQPEVDRRPGHLRSARPAVAGVVEGEGRRTLYRAIPDLAGFVMKADSEGRVGPSTYGRTHADAANVVARALKPHGGLIFYRGFVYDHHMDWRNPKNDRARAAYDNFTARRQVRRQRRHPDQARTDRFSGARAGFAAIRGLEKTNQAIELQITQEYMGQARHLVFLVPMWKEALDFDLHAGRGATPVKALAAGKTFHRPVGGFVGVSNVGLDENWFGNHLSQANSLWLRTAGLESRSERRANRRGMDAAHVSAAIHSDRYRS